MDAIEILALGLILVGPLGLVYSRLTYTKETRPITLSRRDRETVNPPVRGGLVAVLAGAGLLFLPVKRSN